MRPGEGEFRTVLIPAIEVRPDGSRREITIRTQHLDPNIIDEPLEHPDASPRPGRPPGSQATDRKFVQSEGKFSFEERES
jgi:hypothetical protein